MSLEKLKVGCCGFPKGKRKYFDQFKLVEIQQTFYNPPFTGSAQKWREEVPEDFEFSPRSWQEITHLPSSPTYREAGLEIPAGKEGNYGFVKPSGELCEAWGKTRDIAQVLKAKVIVSNAPRNSLRVRKISKI